jgi:hypothetical protein
MAKGEPRQSQKAAAATNKPPATERSASRAAVKPARMPKSSVAPAAPELSSRTTTLDDPMTTSLLAEASRQRSTIEIRPEDIDEAIAAERAAVAADRDPPDGET